MICEDCVKVDGSSLQIWRTPQEIMYCNWTNKDVVMQPNLNYNYIILTAETAQQYVAFSSNSEQGLCSKWPVASPGFFSEGCFEM
jgi:hypothetical protein